MKWFKSDRVAAVEKVCASAHAAAAKTEAAHAKLVAATSAAEERLDKVRSAAAQAESTYDDDPTDKNATAVLKARELVHLEEVRVGAARRRAEESAAKHARACASCRSADAALDDAQREARQAELTKRADLETFRAAAAPHFAALTKAERALREAARAIDAARADSNAAAAELRAAGIDVPDIDAMHLVGALLLARLQSGDAPIPTAAADHVNGIRLGLRRRPLEDVLLGGFEIFKHHGGGALVDASHPLAPKFRADVGAVLQCRTFEEGRRAFEEERKAV